MEGVDSDPKWLAIKECYERMLKEADDLAEKLRKLEAFLQSEKYLTFNVEMRELLSEQCLYMTGYERVLIKRMNLICDTLKDG